MQIFQISALMESIQQAIEEGNEPDPMQLNVLLEEGPKAIESWWDAIDNTQAESDALDKRIKELQARKAARDQAVDRMKTALENFLRQHFNGKVRTAELTTWNQATTSYEFQNIPAEYLKPQEPKVDKARLIADHKAGTLPKSVEVFEVVKESVRVKRG